MSYFIEFKSDALRFLKKQPIKYQLRIKQAIDKLPNGDVKKLVSSNSENLFRLRVR